jgi:hypothetical protein
MLPPGCAPSVRHHDRTPRPATVRRRVWAQSVRCRAFHISAWWQRLMYRTGMNFAAARERRNHHLARILVPGLVLSTIASAFLAFSPIAAGEQTDKLAQAYELLSMGRGKRARPLIDESIATYQAQGDKERLAYAYLVSTDYYRYVASPEMQRFTTFSFYPKPLPPEAVYGVRSPEVIEANSLAEETYRQVIAEAISDNDHLKASRNYMRLLMLYYRGRQEESVCRTLTGILEQFKLAVASQPGLSPFSYLQSPDPSNTKTWPNLTVEAAVDKQRKQFECQK